jgi:hypothetical protein
VRKEFIDVKGWGSLKLPKTSKIHWKRVEFCL